MVAGDRAPALSQAGAVTRAAPTQSFHSAPNLHPPTMTFTGNPDHSSGDVFVTPYASAQDGPMIVDRRGNVLWFHPLKQGQEALDLQVQTYRGQKVLTWWQGVLDADHGTIYGLGHDVIADSSYKTVAVLHGSHPIDLHEFQVTPEGTALVDEYVPVHMNLTSEGGLANGTVLDCVIQEIDIKTGRVLWQWHSLGHVPFAASYWSAPTNPNIYWDYFHLNSIQQLPNGNLLVSARNTWSIYEISRSTGHVLWTMGGKDSTFKMGPGTNFEWQHDARMHPGGILSLLDDASAPQEESEASAKLLRVNTRTMTAQLYRRYTHSPPLLAELAGNAEVLPNHDVFVGWGAAPDFSEYAPGGRQIFNGSFPGGVGTYRAFRFPWTGHPHTPPALAAVSGRHGAVTVYVSWNGATEVSSWRVLGGSRRGALHTLVRSAPWKGFETAIKLPAPGPRYVLVQALDSNGHVLGSSRSTKVAGS